MRLQGKVALVTGGASGFGAGIVRQFVKEGARTVILDLNGGAAEKVAAEASGGTLAVAGDVTKRADIDTAVDRAMRAFGRLDIVVNNAGWTHRNKPMLEVTEEEFDRVFEINVKSIYHMTNAVVPIMRKQGSGCIVNVGSTAGVRPRPGFRHRTCRDRSDRTARKSRRRQPAPSNRNCESLLCSAPRSARPSFRCPVIRRRCGSSVSNRRA